MDATAAPVSTWAPWATSSSWTRMASSGSRGGSTWGVGLHDGDVDALAHQVLGHLQADEAGPDDHGGLGRHADVRGQAGRVFDGAQGAGAVITGDGRAHRGGAHAQHQLVVGHDLSSPLERGAGRDRVRRPVDGDHLVVDPDVEAEPGKELLGRLQGEVVLFFDQPADEIGQAAVGERDVAGALDDGDLARRRQGGAGGWRSTCPRPHRRRSRPVWGGRYWGAPKSPSWPGITVLIGRTGHCSPSPEAEPHWQRSAGRT